MGRHNLEPELAEHPPPPRPTLPDHAGSIPDESLLVPTNETVNTRKVA